MCCVEVQTAMHARQLWWRRCFGQLACGCCGAEFAGIAFAQSARALFVCRSFARSLALSVYVAPQPKMRPADYCRKRRDQANRAVVVAQLATVFFVKRGARLARIDWRTNCATEAATQHIVAPALAGASHIWPPHERGHACNSGGNPSGCCCCWRCCVASAATAALAPPPRKTVSRAALSLSLSRS